MYGKNSVGKDLILLLIGVAMCVGGLFIFSNNVTVSSFSMSRVSYWGMFGGRSMPGGLIVIPLILGIVLWIALPKTFIGKLVTVLGALIIILGVMSSVTLRFRSASLFEYIMMLILIFGGGALALRILLLPGVKDK